MDAGDLQLLRVGPEATYGTTPSPATNSVRIPLSGEATLEYRQPRRELKVLGLSDWSPSKSVLDRATVGGDIPVYLDPLAHSFLLADLFAVATTGVGPYQHVFSLGTPPIGVTYELGDTFQDLYGLINGLRCTGARFRLGDTGPIECTFSYAGKAFTEGTSSVDASPTTYAHNPWDLGRTDLTVEMGGVAITTLNALEFSVARPATSTSYNLNGGGQPGRIALGKGPIQGTAEFDWDSWAKFTAARAGTATSFTVGIALGNGLGSAGNESISIALTGVKLEAASGRVMTEGIAVQSFPFWAEGLTITVKNAIATVA